MEILTLIQYIFVIALGILVLFGCVWVAYGVITYIIDDIRKRLKKEND